MKIFDGLNEELYMDKEIYDDGSKKIPDQKELEKELSEYLSKKYGGRIKIISPLVFPKSENESSDEVQGDFSGGRELEFDMLPEELESYLKSFVVKQRDAISVLATKICTHFNRIKHTKKMKGDNGSGGVGMIKNNVLLIGPTGVGKTYLIKLIAHKLGVPFVKGDATKFSETGYVGGDVEDLVRDLLYDAKEDIQLAENGIIYIDEIDKIASSRNIIGHDVSRTGVQRALLKPMEETDVDLKVPHDPISQIQAIEHYRKTGKREKKVVNTKNILFIMSGAFGDLARIIKKRLQSQGIGFEADVKSSDVDWDLLKEITVQDLIEFGFESEFVGRLPVIVVLDELTRDDLVEILKNPNNPIIISKRLDFKAYGIDIKFENEALVKIADLAIAQKTGARGLVSAMERVLIPFEKKLPSTNIKKFLVTPDVVTHPEEQLEHLLNVADTKEFQDRFDAAVEAELRELKTYIANTADDFKNISGLELNENRAELIANIYLENLSDINTAHTVFKQMYDKVKAQETSFLKTFDMDLSFDEDAVDKIIEEAVKTGRDAGDLAFEIVKRLEYGLNLVKDRSGIDGFVIDVAAVTDMDGYINNLIKKYYRQQV